MCPFILFDYYEVAGYFVYQMKFLSVNFLAVKLLYVELLLVNFLSAVVWWSHITSVDCERKLRYVPKW